jgi:hypothetical protein
LACTTFSSSRSVVHPPSDHRITASYESDHFLLLTMTA